jgi:RNA polymerase sigma factor (sigma-70 family)
MLEQSPRRSSHHDVRQIGRDPDAFEAFYRQHVDGVQRFVARRVGDRDMAADLTADIFVAAIESADRYRPARGSAGAWLFGIARIVVSARLRRDGREQRAFARVVGRELLDSDDRARIDDRLAAEREGRRLHRAMERLSEAERAVLELVALDELSVGEAAAVLGITPVSARVRLHRARRRMADAMREHAEAQPTPQPQETR